MSFMLLITLLLVKHLNAICDVCQPGRAACHSTNTYSICIDGMATRSIIICPIGFTCTGQKFICYPEVHGYKPICNPEDIGPVITNTTPDSSTTEDTNFRNFCTTNGDGAHTNESDSTCKSFIWCYRGRGEIDVCQKVNLKPTYFTGEKCELQKPDYCS